MTSERIKEIQQQTAYPDSISVQQALLQVWNECSQLPQQETLYKENTYKINANTYITNEEEIKKGDWFLEKAGRQHPIRYNGKEKLNFHCKKIILTTDQDLIKDGVATLPQQEISDEEIEKGAREWYDKEGSYEPSAIALKTWVYAIRWYREQLKSKPTS